MIEEERDGMTQTEYDLELTKVALGVITELSRAVTKAWADYHAGLIAIPVASNLSELYEAVRYAVDELQASTS